jgi:hypothetical protein
MLHLPFSFCFRLNIMPQPLFPGYVTIVPT